MVEKQIAVLAGDGHGPYIVRETIRALQKLECRLTLRFNFQYELLGASAIGITGEPLPSETIRLCRNSDAVLVGTLEYNPHFISKGKNVNPWVGLSKLKKAVGLFCDVNPVFSLPVENKKINLNSTNHNIDIQVFSELSGGMNTSKKGRENNNETAYDLISFHQRDIQRIASLSLKAASRRNQKLSLIYYSEQLETTKIWKETLDALAQDYPEIQINCMDIREALKRTFTDPGYFDVVMADRVTAEIFLSQSSIISGSEGLLPSATYGISSCLFEPDKQLYDLPDRTGTASTIASLLSGAMMLDYFDEGQAAEHLRKAVIKTIQTGILSVDNPLSDGEAAGQIGDYLLSIL